MNRTDNAKISKETVAILGVGHYRNPAGHCIDLTGLMQRARNGTRSYPPTAAVPVAAFSDRSTTVEIVNTSTLDAARKLVEAGHRVASLNFASAKNPGGGFLNGAQAQEESLARASGLYPLLLGDAMYDHHRSKSDPLYTNWVIYTPDVPVFRLDDGHLLDEPYLCSFLTSAAVNAGALPHHQGRDKKIREVMQERVERVLALAALHEHDVLILGAWGCGVFKNDPATIAQLFRLALSGPFHGAFTHITFAVLDSSKNRQFIGPFEREFRSS